MNSEGGNHAGSNSDIPRDSPREAQTEGKLEQLSDKTDKLCRSESTAGSESFTEQYVAKLDEQKALRNLSAGEQLQRNGKVELGIITKGFRQGAPCW